MVGKDSVTPSHDLGNDYKGNHSFNYTFMDDAFFPYV